MNKNVIALLALTLAAAASHRASAQDYGTQQPPPPDSSGEDASPFGTTDDAPVLAPADRLEYSLRGITLPSGTLRADATFTLARISDFLLLDVTKTGTFLSFGAAFGVMDNLEVGVSGYRQGALSTGVNPESSGASGAIPFQLTDDFGFGLVTPYARYRILHDQMLQLAAELALVLPTASGSDFGLMFGAPFRLMLAQMIAIDTGLFFQTTFADKTINNLVVPLGFIVNIMPALFLLARMTFTYYDFDTTQLGFDFGGGYTIEGDGEEPMVDIMATFGFPAFVSDGETFTNLWQLNLGASFRLGT